MLTKIRRPVACATRSYLRVYAAAIGAGCALTTAIMCGRGTDAAGGGTLGADADYGVSGGDIPLDGQFGWTTPPPTHTIEDLYDAIDIGSLGIVNAMLTIHPEWVNRQHNGRTALGHAIRARQPDVVQCLLMRGADINTLDQREHVAAIIVDLRFDDFDAMPWGPLYITERDIRTIMSLVLRDVDPARANELAVHDMLPRGCDKRDSMNVRVRARLLRHALSLNPGFNVKNQSLYITKDSGVQGEFTGALVWYRRKQILREIWALMREFVTFDPWRDERSD